MLDSERGDDRTSQLGRFQPPESMANHSHLTSRNCIRARCSMSAGHVYPCLPTGRTSNRGIEHSRCRPSRGRRPFWRNNSSRPHFERHRQDRLAHLPCRCWLSSMPLSATKTTLRWRLNGGVSGRRRSRLTSMFATRRKSYDSRIRRYGRSGLPMLEWQYIRST